MKKTIFLNLKIIGLILVIFVLIFYFRPIHAQQTGPTASVVQLQVCGGAGSCGYGTSLNLGQKLTSYSALVFSGDFSSPFRCEDLNGQSTDRVMTIQAGVLVNSSNPNYTIPADNIELKNTAAHVVGGNCPIDQGTTSWTPIGSMPATILGKTYSTNQACKVQADTVSLRVTTLSGQAVGQYSGELTITYSSFDDTIDCRSAVDPNCQRPDTVINYGGAPMRWAGCNSTLGQGAGITYYGETNNTNSVVYDCNNNILGSNLTQFYSSTGKEINISSGCKIDNIFGKLYKRSPQGSGYGSDLACGFGRHVPSDAERKVLEETYRIHPGINEYTGTDLYIENFSNDMYGSDGRRGKYQGRKNTMLGYMTRELGFPLAGESALGSLYMGLGQQGLYWTQTLSGGSTTKAWLRQINFNKSQVLRNFAVTSLYYSVRCVRNSNCSSDFVCKPGERCEEDASCCKNDITFTTGGNDYTRAGCNSTLGDIQNDPSINSYNGLSLDCANTQSYLQPNGFNYKEIGLGGACKINNNFGKGYQRDDGSGAGLSNNCKQLAGNDFVGSSNNYNCPCPDGRHVPTTTERNTAKDYYTSIGGLNGRSGNKLGLVRKFQLPLAGRCGSKNGGCLARGAIGYYQSATSYSSTLLESQLIYISSDLVTDRSRTKKNYIPVRCVKD